MSTVNFADRAKIVVVPISGGLGNQLFQISAGLLGNPLGRVLLDCDSLNPRSSCAGQPAIMCLRLPDNISFSKDEVGATANILRRWFVRGLFSWSARVAGRSKPGRAFIESSEVLLRLLSRVVLGRFRLLLARTLGFDQRLLGLRFPAYLLGYFQAHQIVRAWADRPFGTIHQSKWIDMLGHLARKEKPLIVHVRLGDYLEHDGFGIPGKTYYSEAIRRANSRGSFENLWVFSDEPEKVMSYLPPELARYRVRIIVPPPGECPANVLEVMRLGAGYILSNSTFGWWAAMLSYSPDAKVTVPSPWFFSASFSHELIPAHWNELPAYFGS